MKTTMHEHKVTTKFKVAAASVLTAAVVGAGAFSLGAESNINIANANQPSGGDPSVSAPNTGGQDALIVSAVYAYMASQSTASDTAFVPAQVKNIRDVELNAVADYNYGDGGAKVYLHYDVPTSSDTEGTWKVVYAGQSVPDQSVIDQYNISSELLPNSSQYGN